MSRVYHEIDHDCVMAICDCEGICAASSRFFFWTDYWRVTESLVVLLCSRSFRISCRSRGCFPLERLESDQLSWLLSLSSGYTGICDIESHHPDDRTHALSNWNDYLSGAKASYLSVHRLRGKDGNYRWILSRGMTVKRSPAGAPKRVIGTHTDLTERKEAEIALRTLATSLEEAQRIAKVGSWELDIPTGALKWSAEIFRLFELDPSQFEATYEGFLNAIPMIGKA